MEIFFLEKPQFSVPVGSSSHRYPKRLFTSHLIAPAKPLDTFRLSSGYDRPIYKILPTGDLGSRTVKVKADV